MTDLRAVAVLVARAPSRAAAVLALVLATHPEGPTVQVALPVDELVIDLAVRRNGRRLAVMVRSGPARTDADHAAAEALSRAGWGVFWVIADRCLTRPQLAARAVLDAVAALGMPEPVRAPPPVMPALPAQRRRDPVTVAGARGVAAACRGPTERPTGRRVGS